MINTKKTKIMEDDFLIRELIRESLRTVMLSDGSEAEYGSNDHLDEYDELTRRLQHLKGSLRTRKNKSMRKEASRLQSAIEAIRYLRRKAQRDYEKEKQDLLV